jgi:glutamate racemase
MANMRADRVILGCTHFPLIEDVFRRHLPPPTRILSQPGIVADSLEDYLERHPAYVGERGGGLRLATTGARGTVSSTLAVFWPQPPTFENVPKLSI